MGEGGNKLVLSAVHHDSQRRLAQGIWWVLWNLINAVFSLGSLVLWEADVPVEGEVLLEITPVKGRGLPPAQGAQVTRSDTCERRGRRKEEWVGGASGSDAALRKSG